MAVMMRLLTVTGPMHPAPVEEKEEEADDEKV